MFQKTSPKPFCKVLIIISEYSEKYQLVKQHDRVGRIADMLEFSKVVLPLERFTPELLEDLKSTCESSISFIENKAGEKQLMIKYMYIVRVCCH